MMMGKALGSGIWKKLDDLYIGENFTSHLILKQELYYFKRKERVDLQSHSGEFNELLCDLSNVVVKLENENKAIILLPSIKSTYKHLFNTLLYGRDSVTLEHA